MPSPMDGVKQWAIAAGRAAQSGGLGGLVLRRPKQMTR